MRPLALHLALALPRRLVARPPAPQGTNLAAWYGGPAAWYGQPATWNSGQPLVTVLTLNGAPLAVAGATLTLGASS